MKAYFVHAPWCSACKAIQNKVPDVFKSVDASDESELTMYPWLQHISSLPAFVKAYDDGQVDWIHTTDVATALKWVDATER